MSEKKQPSTEKPGRSEPIRENVEKATDRIRNTQPPPKHKPGEKKRK